MNQENVVSINYKENTTVGDEFSRKFYIHLLEQGQIYLFPISLENNKNNYNCLFDLINNDITFTLFNYFKTNGLFGKHFNTNGEPIPGQYTLRKKDFQYKWSGIYIAVVMLNNDMV